MIMPTNAGSKGYHQKCLIAMMSRIPVVMPSIVPEIFGYSVIGFFIIIFVVVVMYIYTLCVSNCMDTMEGFLSKRGANTRHRGFTLNAAQDPIERRDRLVERRRVLFGEINKIWDQIAIIDNEIAQSFRDDR